MSKLAFRAFMGVIIISVVVAPGLFAQRTLERIAARVNNEIILESDVEAQKKSIRDEMSQQGLTAAQLESMFQERSRNILRDLIDVSLLIQQAKDLGMSADLEVIRTEEKLRQENNRDPSKPPIATIDDLEKAISQQMSLEDFKQRIRTDVLKNQVINEQVYRHLVITTEDQKNYYEQHKKDFDKPPGVQIREILVNTQGMSDAEVVGQRKKIDDALAAVKKGTDFGEVAQKYSESDTAPNGGDLGFFAQGTLNKAIEDVVSKLEKGEVSDVIKTQFGFMLFKLDDKHSGGIRPFESVQNEVYSMMFNDLAQPKIREYLKKLRDEGFVEVRPGFVDTGAVVPQ